MPTKTQNMNTNTNKTGMYVAAVRWLATTKTHFIDIFDREQLVISLNISVQIIVQIEVFHWKKKHKTLNWRFMTFFFILTNHNCIYKKRCSHVSSHIVFNWKKTNKKDNRLYFLWKKKEKKGAKQIQHIYIHSTHSTQWTKFNKPNFFIFCLVGVILIFVNTIIFL